MAILFDCLILVTTEFNLICEKDEPKFDFPKFKEFQNFMDIITTLNQVLI